MRWRILTADSRCHDGIKSWQAAERAATMGWGWGTAGAAYL
jgi:hypothetical protein